MGGEGGWDHLDPDVAGRRLYVVHENHVVVVDMDTLKVVGDVPDCPGMGESPSRPNSTVATRPTARTIRSPFSRSIR